MSFSIPSVGSSSYFDGLDPDTKEELSLLFQNVSDELSQNEGFCRQLIKVDDFFRISTSSGLATGAAMKIAVKSYLIKALNWGENLALLHLSEPNGSVICANTLAHVINEEFNKSLNRAPALRTGSEISDVMDLQRRTAVRELAPSLSAKKMESLEYEAICSCLLLGRLGSWLQDIADFNNKLPLKGLSEIVVMKSLSEEEQRALLMIDAFAKERLLSKNQRAFPSIVNLIEEIELYGSDDLKNHSRMLKAFVEAFQGSNTVFPKI